MDPRTPRVAFLARLLLHLFPMSVASAVADVIFTVTRGHAHLIRPEQLQGVEDVMRLWLSESGPSEA